MPPPYFDVARDCDKSRVYATEPTNCKTGVASHSLALQLEWTAKAADYAALGVANRVVVINGAATNCRHDDYSTILGEEAKVEAWHADSFDIAKMTMRWQNIAVPVINQLNQSMLINPTNPAQRAHVMLDCESPDLVRPKKWYTVSNHTLRTMIHEGVRARISFARAQLDADGFGDVLLGYYGMVQPRNGVLQQPMIDAVADAAVDDVFASLDVAVANPYIGAPNSTQTSTKVAEFTINSLLMASATLRPTLLLLWPREQFLSSVHGDNLYEAQLEAAALYAGNESTPSAPLNGVAWWAGSDQDFNATFAVINATRPFPRLCCDDDEFSTGTTTTTTTTTATSSSSSSFSSSSSSSSALFSSSTTSSPPFLVSPSSSSSTSTIFFVVSLVTFILIVILCAIYFFIRRRYHHESRHVHPHAAPSNRLASVQHSHRSGRSSGTMLALRRQSQRSTRSNRSHASSQVFTTKT